MILDLNKFITQGRVIWSELEDILVRIEQDPDLKLDMEQLERFHYLYQRTCADLARLADFSARQEIRTYLESLVARSFSLIHKPLRSPENFKIFTWFFSGFPSTFRKHMTAFWISAAILMAGTLFGASAIALDSQAKPALMPFSHLMQDPAQRVAKEEAAQKDKIAGKKSSFASYLISNNTRVAFFALSLGITWGVGTVLVVFSNGVYLGATIADYILAGQTRFLLGWLLPHGSIELPAIILAAQAGFILAGALIGPVRNKTRQRALSLKYRLRNISSDLFTLMGGVCLMLIWAGFIEAFLSQYHEPAISYTTKILFGTTQLMVLFIFLFFSGRTKPESDKGRQIP
ncbi:MAG: stage II sporulation protein M [Proteobacteria bacterium]|nr:stage II sporulation protein M [Pseudomonadota bacterium]MBU1389227.1 stage II sporulation protein M [Pseudomonadota bacterium]MBU1544791.1 stage II sporulation protein M [Pseudomonadota bacterium]MBU2431717.1 stage II sporulation protein M [Pseudomonadota bacterium]MBU2481895.1 stage II sporulation protein M [Pseudomonadota bacterium]